MKRVLSIASLLFCITLTVSLSAQTPPAPAGTTAPTAGMKITTDAEFATHMKEIQQHNGVLNKSIKGGTWEFCYILSGVSEITEDGKPPVRVKAGDSFVMKPDFTGVWRCIETTRKIWVVYR